METRHAPRSHRRSRQRVQAGAVDEQLLMSLTLERLQDCLPDQLGGQQRLEPPAVRVDADALTSGVGSLVDADMNVASTRLQALQTQQQLGIQALSMANNNSQLILKLFQAA